MLSRRAALTAGLAAPWAGQVAAGLPAAASGVVPPEVRPREAWASGRGVRGTLQPEDDVRFLLVHHTLTPNTDGPDDIVGRLRSIQAFHTGERGWADVAYNFLVDPSGTIWEGRQGSLEGPVRGDATGGSQGFAQLACFIGDFSEVLPTPAALDAMVRLLAWLATRSSLPLEGTVTFTSRGSSRWPRGAEVTTARIAAHRDMSVTECPGEALYPLVAGELLPRAQALLGVGSPSPSPDAVPAAVPTSPPPGVSGTSDSLPLVLRPEALIAGVTGIAALAGGAALLARRSAQHQRQQGPAEDDGGDQSDEEPHEGP